MLSTTTTTTAAAAAAAATSSSSSSFFIFRHVQNSVRKRMSWIGVLRAELLKTQIYWDVELYLTFPCASMLCRRTAVPLALPFTHIPFHLITIQQKQLQLQGKEGCTSWSRFTYNPKSCFHHHQVIINNSSSSVSNLRHGRPSPQTTSHITTCHSMSLQSLSTIFVTYFRWHHRYKLDGSNRFVCLITELIGNKGQHALCKTANSHCEIMSGI